MNIIDALFMGKIRPTEYGFGDYICDLPLSEEYKTLSDDYSALFDEIKASLPEDKIKKLIQLSDVQSSINYECDKTAFYKGFIIGARITAEVFGGNN